MNENKFFMHQIKRTGSVIDKGIVVKADADTDNLSAAKQSYHAYLGAYAYGHDQNTDYVSCKVTNLSGAVLLEETWEESRV